MSKIHTTKCPLCGGMMKCRGTESTCVAYHSPPGHVHDDNCRTRHYVCDCGHFIHVSKRNRCPVCGWVGKKECQCCGLLKKVDEWPEEYVQ